MLRLWLLSIALALPGCGLIAGLGEQQPVREDVGDVGTDALDDTGVDSPLDTASDTTTVGDVPTDADTGSLAANVLLVDAAKGRLALSHMGSGPWKLVALPTIDAGYTQLARVGASTAVLLDPVKHCKLVVTFDRAAFSVTTGTPTDVDPSYDRLVALSGTDLLLLATTTGGYRVERHAGADWTKVDGKATSTDFLGKDVLALSQSGDLVLVGSGGSQWFGAWTGTLFSGLHQTGLTAGWSHIAPVGGPTVLIYSNVPGPAYGVVTLLQPKLAPDGWRMFQLATFFPSEVPWTEKNWTSIVPTAPGEIQFYRQSDGLTRLLRVAVAPSAEMHLESLATDAAPGPGWTGLLALE